SASPSVAARRGYDGYGGLVRGAGARVGKLHLVHDAVAIVAVGLAVAAADRLPELRAEHRGVLAGAHQIGRAARAAPRRVAPLVGAAGEAGDRAALPRRPVREAHVEVGGHELLVGAALAGHRRVVAVDEGAVVAGHGDVGGVHLLVAGTDGRQVDAGDV